MPVSLPDLLPLWQQTLHWQPTPQQHEQFQQLYDLIVAGNQQQNLTRITDPTEFWEKHLWDSLSGIQPLLSAAVPEPAVPFQVIDIGTGAGFPGLPVAIVQPHWQVTLLDSTQKKVTFLQTVVDTLPLPNGVPLVGRAEQLGHTTPHRAGYDLALLRAVSAASVCAEYALPLLKMGGLAILYRGHWSDAEAEQLQGAIAQLGGRLESTIALATPMTQGVRHCLYLRKVASTPQQFPRAIGIPAHQPL